MTTKRMVWVFVFASLLNGTPLWAQAVDPVPPPPVIVFVPPSTPLDLSGLESKIDALARDLAAHEKAEAEFREQARGIWKEFFQPVLVFAGKYIAPALGAYLIGHQVAQQ